MVEVIFSFHGSLTSMQCNDSDIMKDIIEKYISKIELVIDINKIYFLYGGNIINNELSVKELTNENIINILVSEIEEENAKKKEEKKKLKKSNIIVCSLCKEICKLEIKNYQIKLYGCENDHIINDILINDFNETQYIDESKIICDICKFANKNEQYNKEFNYCNTCESKLCPLCKSKHDKSHIIIDYNKRIYLCHEHNEKFISYCNDCNKNLCFNCDKEHKKEHKIKSFKDFRYNGEELRKDIKEFQERIAKVNDTIEGIINIMNDLKKNIENYNDIFCNILNNYEQDNRNYYILKNINELLNNDITKDIENICNNKENNIFSHFKVLMKMYTNMNINNISDDLIKNKNEFEIEFKNVKYLNLSEVQLLYKYGENSIFKIFNSDYKKFLGIGFLIQVNPFSMSQSPKVKFPFRRGLFTCNHIFPEEFFNNNERLYFIHKNVKKQIYIRECQIFSKNPNYLDFRKGFDKRKIFLDKELDYTFIEILDSDDIFDKKFELFKIETLRQKNLLDIAILHYPTDEGLSFSLGIFQKKNDNSLVHNCLTSLGSEGAPIINLNNIRNIIGIHCGNIGNVGLGYSMDIILLDIINIYKYIKCLYKENSLKNNFITLTIHQDYITNLILLNNNTLSSCSTDRNIIFFNANNFLILDIIKEKEEIIYHEKLSDNSIILCCKDGSLKIYKEKGIKAVDTIVAITKIITVGGTMLFAPTLTPLAIRLLFDNKAKEINKTALSISNKYELLETLKGHQDSVCQVIEMSEGLIISCGLDTKMKIWQKKGNNFTCINTLIVNDEPGFSTNILKINENEIVSAATNANYIIFWNINTFKQIKKIDNIVCHWNRNSMKMINENTLFIGGDEYNGIYLIDVINYQFASHIIIEKIASISAIIKLNNGNILIGCKKENRSEEEEENISYAYSLIEYNYNSKEKTLTEVRTNEDAHTNIITGLIKLSHNEIVSCGLDKTIKFWI